MHNGHGYIWLHRKMLEWEWYDDINTKTLFIHILLKTNWKDKKWKGKTIKRGQFVTSIRNLAEETGLSVRSVRTALEHLETTREITRETTHHWTTINVLKYEKYQPDLDKNDTPNDKPPTHDRHTTDTRPTHTNKEKKDNKEINKEDTVGKPDPIPYKEIIDYLNEKAGRSFKHNTRGHRKHIKARWNEGFTLDEFKKAIDNKVAEWKNNPEMCMYLQPSTLFSDKMDNYVNQGDGKDEKAGRGSKKKGKWSGHYV